MRMGTAVPSGAIAKAAFEFLAKAPSSDKPPLPALNQIDAASATWLQLSKAAVVLRRPPEAQ